MKSRRRTDKKAISPILATVILIAITLIAAIAIAGFVFGLFGTFTNTAQVQASPTTCVQAGGTESCSIVLTNTGNANTQVTGSCSITYDGMTNSATVAPLPTVIPSGSSVTVTCTDTGPGAPAGTQVTGSIILANGANALFSTTGT